MKFFGKSKTIEGWRALSFQGGEIRAVHVRRSGSAKPVVSLAAIEQLRGSNNEAALARLAKTWGDATFACTTGVNGGSYEFLPVEAPNVPAAELKSAITFVVKDMIDINESQTTIDIVAVPHDKNNAQRVRSMYAVAIRSGLTADIQKWFEAAKLGLKVIDIPEMAQRNIAILTEEGDRITTMVSFDETSGLLTFSGSGELFLSRRIDVTLAQLLDTDVNQRSLYQERVALEIQRSLDHFGRQFNWVSVGKVVVAPLADDDCGLVSSLRENLEARVEALNLDTLLDISAVPQLKSLDHQRRYFLPLGLALRHEEKVL